MEVVPYVVADITAIVSSLSASHSQFVLIDRVM